ncbi:MAG: ATP synthase F1 subunit gamma [Kiritimatiellaeota bacterium]|nr:ATP synthase F1 subunit gamma [Kiritimatiellota bacterium]
MNNLREIKSRLRSIRKNRQILSAMKMVSAVKLRRIQVVVQASRPYAQRLEALVQNLLDMPEARALQHPLMSRRSVHRVLWVVISTDRGLCGSLNTNLFRFIQQALRERAGAKSTVALWLIGRKAGDFFKRALAKSADFRIEQAYPLEEAQAENIVRQVCDLYRKGQVDQVDLFYAQCKSTLRQIPAKVPLLPLAPSACPPDSTKALSPGRSALAEHGRPGATGTRQQRAGLFEPAPGTIADDLLPRYLASQVRQILFEEQVSEHSARMIMMDQASKNASDMISQIQLDYNTLRQGMITRELTDITTGVEAMA